MREGDALGRVERQWFGEQFRRRRREAGARGGARGRGDAARGEFPLDVGEAPVGGNPGAAGERQRQQQRAGQAAPRGYGHGRLL